MGDTAATARTGEWHMHVHLLSQSDMLLKHFMGPACASARLLLAGRVLWLHHELESVGIIWRPSLF